MHENRILPVVVAGMLMVALGLVFMLQSEAYIGPESSFMYANPEWNVNGRAIASIGVITCVAGLLMQWYARSLKR